MPSNKNWPRWLKWVLKKLDGISATGWWVIGGGLITVVAAWWSPVQAALRYQLEIAVWHLLLGAAVPLIIALIFSVHRRGHSNHAVEIPRPVEVVDSRRNFLWLINMEQEYWVNTDPTKIYGDFADEILEGPYCGAEIAKRKCRGVLWSDDRVRSTRVVPMKCPRCKRIIDHPRAKRGARYEIRQLSVSKLKKYSIRALQTLVRRTGKPIRSGTKVDFDDT